MLTFDLQSCGMHVPTCTYTSQVNRRLQNCFEKLKREAALLPEELLAANGHSGNRVCGRFTLFSVVISAYLPLRQLMTCAQASNPN